MLSNLWIRDFRAIRELRLEGLTPVTLLTGDNNCGKTSVLEAAWWLHGCWVGGISSRISRFRGAPETLRPINDFFRNLDSNVPVRIDGMVNSLQYQMTASIEPVTTKSADIGSLPLFVASATKAPEELRVVYSQTKGSPDSKTVETAASRHVYSEDRGAIESGPTFGLPTAMFLNSRGINSQQEDIARFSELVQQGADGRLMEVLQCIDDRIERAELIAIHGEPTLYLRTKGHERPIPLFAFGQGMARTVTIALGMLSCRGGTVFLDEIENGIHYSRLRGFWDQLIRIAIEFDCQLIATTHSRDCVQAAFRASGAQIEPADKVSVFRMCRANSQISATRLSGEVLEQTLSLDLPVV